MTLPMPLPELLLTLYLLLILPAHAMWRSNRTNRRKGGRSTMAMYRSNITHIVLLLLALLACTFWSGYTAAQMGLAWPPGTAGMWGLGVAVLAVLGMAVIMPLHAKRMTAEQRAQYEVKAREMPGMPRTPRELAVFVVLAVLLGAGWELLYRGFLLMVLSPVTGTAGAVVLSSLAYGTGHGYHNKKQFIGSIVAAFVFMLAYVATGSLWWLIVIHMYLPLSSGIAGYRLSPREAVSTEPVSAEPVSGEAAPRK